MCLQTVTDTVEKRTGIKVLHIHSAHNSYNRQHIALCVFFLTCIKGSKNGQLSILLSPSPPRLTVLMALDWSARYPPHRCHSVTPTHTHTHTLSPSTSSKLLSQEKTRCAAKCESLWILPIFSSFFFCRSTQDQRRRCLRPLSRWQVQVLMPLIQADANPHNQTSMLSLAVSLTK